MMRNSARASTAFAMSIVPPCPTTTWARGETDAGALGTGREERQEDIAAQIFGHALAAVFDLDPDLTATARSRAASIVLPRRASTLGRRAKQVDQHLRQ